MTMKELVPLLIEDGKYFTEEEAQVPVMVQARKHKNWKTNKKWLKRYGYKVIYQTKRAKVLDVTIERVVEFCAEKGLPLPDEILGNVKGSDE